MTKYIKKIIKKCVKKFYFFMTKVLSVNNKVIFFESNVARNYTGNPKYIYEYMVKQGLDKTYRCIWSLEDVNTPIIGNAKKVKRSRFRYYYYLAIAKIWVADCRQPGYLVKRENVSYIQTWHGTPLKKLALDMDKVNMGGQNNIETYHRNFYNNTRSWDYLISQNSFSAEIFRRCFAFDKTMLEIGYPRNDILINENKEDTIKKLKQKLGLPLDKKVLLYAPTWRDNEYHKKGIYKFVSKLDYENLKQNLGADYVLIVKYHYLVHDTIDWEKYQGFIYQYSEQQDIAELYLVSDSLITDYSSVMFDYSILKRPMFFFAYDLEDYKNNLRGFYFDFIAEVPGAISLTTEELIRDIKEYEPEKWKEKYLAFTKKYNHRDDGQASKKVCDLMISLAKEE